MTRIALAGVGNCASALVQGLVRYGRPGASPAGLMNAELAGESADDVRIVAAFDIDRRKVGRPLHDAVFAPPNCAAVFEADLPEGSAVVLMGPVLDGVSSTMDEVADARRFLPSDREPVDVAAELRQSRAEVLVLMLPVGSERAARHYAQAALDAGVGLVNCVPVLLASDPLWADRFAAAGLPLIGDDIKSQFGATFFHRTLARAMADRGLTIKRGYQLNTGGNTDFLNMLDRGRLATKRRSKTEAVQSQLPSRLPSEDLHVGPSDYVPWQGDRKVAFVRMEWEGFGGVPMHVETRMEVEDSPNCAGVVLDAVRVAGAAHRAGRGGALHSPSAWYMKHPPEQMSDHDAERALRGFLDELDSTP